MTRFIKFATLFFLITAPAKAEELLAPIDFKGNYRFSAAGIAFGTIDIAFTQTATSYKAVSDVSTVGIAKVFVQHTSHTTSEGTGADFDYPNIDYVSDYATRGKRKSAKFTKTNGVIVVEQALPLEDRNKRPEVPQEQKNAAYDPLSVALMVRAHTARAATGGPKNFSIDYYDGKRLTRGNFTFDGEKTIKIDGEKYPTYVIKATREAIAGFSEKELDRMKDDPTATLYFSNDGRMIPLKLDVPLALAAASATLQM